jgi:parallel beta-helix repeat protein
MRRFPARHFTFISLPIIGLVVLGERPAHAFTNVSACGQKLTVAGEYLLTADLDCSNTFTNGIEIAASDVVLHLAGHTITSTDCDATKGISGILVDNGVSGVKVEGGTVHGFNDGIALAANSSRVTGMTFTGNCIFGAALSGVGNQLDTSVVTLAGLDGVGIGSGTGTIIRHNDISDNARVGVDISNFSNDNVVEDNIINRNGIRDGEQGGIAIFNGNHNLIANNALSNNFNGIEIESPDNTVRGNAVNGSVSVGIFIISIGSPSTVKHNTVLGSGLVDLDDDSPTCSANVWRKNTFQTDLAGAASDGGPGTGCVQ